MSCWACLERIWIAVFGLLLAALAGCSRVPDCDSARADAIVQESILRVIARSFRDGQETSAEEVSLRKPGALPNISARHQAMMNRFHPELSLHRTQPLVAIELAKRVPEEHKAHPLALVLQLRQFSLLSRSLELRLADQEARMGSKEDDQRGRKLCAATLYIRPRNGDSRHFASLHIRYGLNPPPRGRRTPFYLPLSEFAVDPPDLAFALSGSEKVALMATGETRDMTATPRPHDGFTLILNQSMLALLADMNAAPL